MPRGLLFWKKSIFLIKNVFIFVNCILSKVKLAQESFETILKLHDALINNKIQVEVFFLI